MTTTGQCPATRGPQTCASIGPHTRHIWTDPQPDAEPATEPDQALVEAVAKAVHDVWCQPDCGVPGHQDTLNRLNADEAAAAIAAVRAWDAEHEPFSVATIERPGCAPIVTLVWPRGRAEAVWVSADLVESLVHRVEVKPDAGTVPPCPGHADAGPAPDGGRYGSPCTLPLGHHGGCR